jgi:hypothetical protein
MALRSFTYADFEETRTLLVKEINHILTDRGKRLLLSFKSGEPLWGLSDTIQLQKLPAVQWKLTNVRKLLNDDPAKHAHLLEKLRVALYGIHSIDARVPLSILQTKTSTYQCISIVTTVSQQSMQYKNNAA